MSESLIIPYTLYSNDDPEFTSTPNESPYKFIMPTIEYWQPYLNHTKNDRSGQFSNKKYQNDSRNRNNSHGDYRRDHNNYRNSRRATRDDDDRRDSRDNHRRDNDNFDNEKRGERYNGRYEDRNYDRLNDSNYDRKNNNWHKDRNSNNRYHDRNYDRNNHRNYERNYDKNKDRRDRYYDKSHQDYDKSHQDYDKSHQDYDRRNNISHNGEKSHEYNGDERSYGKNYETSTNANPSRTNFSLGDVIQEHSQRVQENKETNE
ncbi:hypothetical protein TRFO_07970 [Tritrichomonas foetus]|uniref:Uncharacterized protein n=1 Tax=Tritrichomonas foetus TaxID=1144522 RepID=A0A1J4JMK7_9EUKA|nr:hypothetical protein TRFO_07970 [Tritrichomonas foetus]|eukprot:OHT00307.1 hypothetical protein TRFO_07970 [Tritrichomonas foetus]